MSKAIFWILTVGMTAAVVTLIYGGVNGWFVRPVEMEASDYCEGCGEEYANITVDEYEKKISERKSFVLLVDQTGCTTADKLRGFVTDYARAHDLRVYRIMFNEMKNTALHETVKHYPSVVIFSHGEVVKYLRADKDEDAGIYNNEDEFRDWIDKYVR